MALRPNAVKPGTPVILGIPFDANSSWLRGAAGAPPIIRVALNSISSNLWTETGVDLGAEGVYCDAGDLKFTFDEPFAAIERKVGELLDKGLRPVCLGGDHSITLPIVRAFGKHIPGLSILHFDAHPDLYDELEGNRLSHACPFARIMEEGAAKRLIQIGIRTMTGHQREQSKKFGVEVIEMQQLPALDRMKVDGPIYISFDMDAFDPAFAPGISHREPGGMSVREAIAHLHAITGKIAGADIVEFNPAQDNTQITATVAAKLLKEILGKMVLN
ncbi:MAG TPA: agmatinase [Terriglobales bacterium]|nr:agmatinase [Terriglobales bacterium]